MSGIGGISGGTNQISLTQETQQSSGTTQTRMSEISDMSFEPLGKDSGSNVKGSGDDAPKTSGKVAKFFEKVGNFFSNVGSTIVGAAKLLGSGIVSAANIVGGAIASAFDSIKSSAPGNTPPVQGDVDTTVTKTTVYSTVGFVEGNFNRDGVIDPAKAGTVLGRVASENSLAGATLAMTGLAAGVEGKNLQNEEGFVEEFVERMNFAGGDGDGLRPGNLGTLKAMVPELRIALADNPTALLILDQIEGFDFEARLQEAWEGVMKPLHGNSKGEYDLGSFNRNKSFFSTTMKLYQLDGSNPTTTATKMLKSQAENLDSIRSDLSKVDIGMDAIATVKGDVAKTISSTAENMLTALFDKDNPVSLDKQFSQEYLGLLKGFAQQIAEMDGPPAEVKNEAIQKLYSDATILRGIAPALTMHESAQSDKTVKLVAGLVNSVVNNAVGGKMSEDIRPDFEKMRDDFQVKMFDTFVRLGMPVVVD